MIKESPDELVIPGIKGLQWYAPDAWCFWAWKHWAVAGEKLTHPQTAKMLMKQDQIAKAQAWAASRQARGFSQILFSGVVNKVEWADFLEWTDYNEGLSRSGVGPNGASGRFWTKSKIVSFWQTREKALPYFASLSVLLGKLGMRLHDFRFQFIDSDEVMIWTELNNPRKGTQRSDSDIKKLQAQQHLSPEIKREFSLPLAGSVKAGDRAAAQGFDNVARLNLQRVGDSVKLSANYLLDAPK